MAWTPARVWGFVVREPITRPEESITPARRGVALCLRLLFGKTDALRFLRSLTSPRAVLAAENLFLRKQLAFYQEHQIRPRRLTAAARFSLLVWSRFCDWRSALVIVKPETLIGWHRKGFKLFWKWKSRPGRPRIPADLRQLIAEMIRENPTWGQARIADELFLKLGIKVSPRTVRAYWPSPMLPTRPRPTSQSWHTFIHNHAQAVVACDFMAAITVRFRVLYVLLLIEIGSRRIVHGSVTEHPTADWTVQEFREAIPNDHGYRFLIHDRDSIFSAEVDEHLQTFGLKILRTPVKALTANAYCERLIVRHPLAKDSAQVTLVDGNHVVQAFSSNRSNQPLAVGVGIWRLHRSA